MSTLKSTIEDLAAEFAMRIIGALRAASIDELSSVAGLAGRRGRGGRSADIESGTRRRGRGGRLGRRSSADIGKMVDDIVALLEKHPEGLRAEQIREALACQSKELPRPLADALGAGRIKKSGQKRATTYFIADGASGGSKKRARPRRSKKAEPRG